MLDGSAGIAEYWCRPLLGDRYPRLAPTFPEDVNILLDDVKWIRSITDFAAKLPLDATIDRLKRNW